MRILITGPRGFVGQKLMRQYPNAVGAPSLREADEDAVREMLETVKPDAIVHTAAVSDIGACDRDPEGSYRANVLLPVWLAKHSKGVKKVFFSSDQVYGGCCGDGPYREEDALPDNRYARQKLEMEQRVLELDDRAVLLRAEWMYDYKASKGNYFLNVRDAAGPLSFSTAQYRGVTYLKEVAENMDAAIRLPGGAYNFGSETDRSMYRITAEFLSEMGRDTPLEDCLPRHNLWMDCAKARKYGVVFSSVSDGLKRCLKDSRE